MGAISSSNFQRNHEVGKQVCQGYNHIKSDNLKECCESKKTVSKKDLAYLVGKPDHLPVYTKKLFSSAKLYLDAGLCRDVCNQMECKQTHSTEEVSRLGLEPADLKAETSNIAVDSCNSEPKLTPQLEECSPYLFKPLTQTIPLFQSQTYTRWKIGYQLSNIFPICSKKPKSIHLLAIEQLPDFISSYQIQIGNLKLNLFELLQGFLELFFSGFEVLPRNSVICASMTKNIRFRTHELTKQAQVCVTDIHPVLQKTMLPDVSYVVAISWTDLYPENYNFVLGEASCSHRTAVVSFGRFETKDFNAETHEDISQVNGKLLWKLFKTLSHELCHLLGLEHCKYFSCAMNESGSVAEAMSQPLFLCPVCLRKLHQACQFDILERYQQLYKFLNEITNQLNDSEEMKQSADWCSSCIQFLMEAR